VSTTEELLGRKSSRRGPESREYGHRDPSRGTLYPQNLALTSPTSGGRSVGIVADSSHGVFLLVACALSRYRTASTNAEQSLLGNVRKLSNSDGFFFETQFICKL
jgi:hypothetical protein